MQVSLKWLKDYVDIEIEPDALASTLTMAGLEVDSLERKASSFTGVVAARILTKKPHPRADKLSLCEVTDGSETYSVVCGAPNIMVGDIVPLAKIGAVLPGGFSIKEAKIRGELSFGMLCSEEELGIGSDASGVMILFRPEEGEQSDVISWTGMNPEGGRPLVLGEDLSKAPDLSDVIFDISVTPNRSDCLSVTGLAREIAALTGKKFRGPQFALAESEENISGLTSVSIEDPDLCPRYTARIIKNISIRPSPLWLRMRLEGAGLRPISNVVDVTNFVMLELGQPLHAFDYRYLAEGRIVVRRSKEGEIFTTLDGKERVLKSDVLLICDGEKPVAIGGIMGGQNSEVKEDTETVLLESAYFDPVSIRRSSRWLSMTTDAAFRFERGIDPEGVAKAQNRAAQLMAELSGGCICRDLIDQYPKKVATATDIPVRVKRVRDILGIEIKGTEILSILESLGMSVREGDKGSEEMYLVVPPSFRVDLWREIDIIEEIARIHGYDSIPATLPVVSLAPVRQEARKALEDRIRGVLTGSGCSEVITYSFVSPQWPDRFDLSAEDERRRLLRIKNPLVEDQSVMRTMLLSGLLETMKKNAAMGCFDLKIFEIGRIFFARQKGELPLEKNRLGCLLTGLQDDELWHSTRVADFYDLKGILEGVFSDLRIGGVQFIPDIQEPFLHPTKSAGITVGARQAGYIGQVHGDVLERLDIRNAAYVLELDTDILAEECSSQVSYREISRFPSITRDVAFLIDKQWEAGKVLGFIESVGEELLEKVRIFDVYEGKGIPDGLRSLGLRFTYRSSEKTLTDEEITAVHGGIVERIIGLTDARIRG